ncbi:MAG: T9SS type A sorting domain-containing protein [Flavobacterium sp.]
MIKSLQKSALKLFLVLAIMASASAFAQTPVALPAVSPYSQDFNTTPGASGTSYPAGWVAYQGTTADAAMLVSTATTTTGGNHNYGSCIGLLASGSYGAPLYNVLAIANTTGKTALKISYKVRKIREQGRNESFNLEISTTSATTGFTAVTNGAYDSGSLAEGNVATYTNLDISALDNKTSTVWLRWAYTELGGSGSRDGIALDDVVISYTAPPLVPDAPVATAATGNTTGSSFVANWNSVGGATGYRLDVATDNAFADKLEDYDDIAVNGTSKLVNTGILPNTTYYYRVRAEINAETSANSNIITVNVGSFVMQAPVATAATVAGSTGFTANWNSVAGATGYYLDVSTSPDFGVVQENVIVETFNNMGTPASAYANRTWTGDGGITWTANAARTDWFSYMSSTDRILGLFENAPADDAYLISGEITGDINHISFDAWKVFNNGSHTVVTVYLLTGPSFATETVLGTHATPTTTTVKNTFTKNLPSMVTGPYKIKIAVTENVVSTPANTARTGLDNIKFGMRNIISPLFVTGYENLNVGNVTSYQVTGLEPGTIYYYRVRAYSATDTSEDSNVITATTSCIVVTPPTASAQQFCGSATVADLDLAEDNVHWYSVQTNGTELAPATALSTGTYYASLKTGNCESTRVAVAVTVGDVTAPVVAPLTLCANSTVANLTANGTGLKWYADATATTPLDAATPVTAGDYYVTQTVNACESPTAVVAVTITPTPDAPTAADQTFCGPATVAALTPAPVTGIAPIVEHFENAITGALTGSHNFATGPWAMQNGTTNTDPANSYNGNSVRFAGFHRYTSPAFNKIKTVKFFARAETPKTLEVKKIVGAAESSLQIINLTTTMQQYTVQVNEVNDNVKIQFLGEATPALAYLDEVEFIFNDGTPEIKWYDDATGGGALASTASLASGDYFVAQVINGCEGPRTEVEVIINPIPDAPVVTALTLCGTPTVAELTATGTGLKWYAAETGGTVLANTEAVVAGNYYVSQTIDSCESPRAEVTVTISAIPDAPVATPLAFCGSATVAELTATGTALKWYADETGGTALAGIEALSTDTYYVSQTIGTCESPRASVVVTVNPLPDAPEAVPLSFCGSTTANQLSATNGTALKWYTAAVGGTALTGTETVITGDYYVSQTIDGCESARTMVAVTVNTIPSAPSVNEIAQTFCSGATVADFLPQDDTIKWYTSSSNGTALSDDTLLTAGLSIYYASQTVNGCESTTRTPVAVQVNTTAQPVANGSYAFCHGATAADLDATGVGLKWYASLTATDELETTAILETQIYYVTQTINACESPRLAVPVTVTNPVATGAAVQQYNTGETLADLDVTGPGIVWYADEDLTQELPATTVLTEWYTYYAVPNIGDCTGEALAVQVDDLLGNGGFDVATLKYYPNPVKDVLNVSYSEAITGVEVYTMLGQVVVSKTPNAAIVQVDMSTLQAGTYMLRLQAGNATQTIRLIKQ